MPGSFKDLGMKCMLAKFVQWLLTAEWEEPWLTVASNLLEHAEAGKNCFKNIRTLPKLRTPCKKNNWMVWKQT
jgi:hypothetical protein